MKKQNICRKFIQTKIFAVTKNLPKHLPIWACNAITSSTRMYNSWSQLSMHISSLNSSRERASKKGGCKPKSHAAAVIFSAIKASLPFLFSLHQKLFPPRQSLQVCSAQRANPNLLLKFPLALQTQFKQLLALCFEYYAVFLLSKFFSLGSRKTLFAARLLVKWQWTASSRGGEASVLL